MIAIKHRFTGTPRINVKSEYQGEGVGMITMHNVTRVEREGDGSLTAVIPNELRSDEFDKHLLNLNKVLLDRCAAAEAREGILRDTLRLNHEWHIRNDEHDGYGECDLFEANDAGLNMPHDDAALQVVVMNRIAETGLDKRDIVSPIRQFNTLAGNTDDVFNVRQAAMYFGLQLEEVAEKLSTLGLIGSAHDLANLGYEFKRGDLDSTFITADRKALLDDDVDIGVVTIGSLLSMGVDIYGAFAEVSRSNMSKVFPDGTLHKDDNGKIQKGPNYSKPDLAPFVCQRAAGSEV